MKETTVLNNISKLVENIDYQKIYIEINTKTNKYTIEKDKSKQIGFDTGGRNEYKSKCK